MRDSKILLSKLEAFENKNEELKGDFAALSEDLSADVSMLLTELEMLKHPSVLIVDDDRVVAETLTRILTRKGFKTSFETNPLLVQDRLFDEEAQVLLVDVHMPEVNGLDLLRQITATNPDIIAIVGTGAPTVTIVMEALRLGAVDFLLKPFEAEQIVAAINRGVARRQSRLLQRHDQLNLEKTVLDRSTKLVELTRALASRNRDIANAYAELLKRLGRASQWRDDETGHHIQRIGMYSAEIAKKLGLGDEDVKLIRESSPMHDIGKIGVPDAILLKPGRLTPIEFECMKAHTLIGAELLSGSDVPVLRASEQIALSHHEWYNGGGYPYGLAGDEIPLFARIVALADVYDALTHDRPYKKAMTIDETISLMTARRGTQFDPEVFDTFLTAAEGFSSLERQLVETPLPVSSYRVDSKFAILSQLQKINTR